MFGCLDLIAYLSLGQLILNYQQTDIVRKVWIFDSQFYMIGTSILLSPLSKKGKLVSCDGFIINRSVELWDQTLI